MVIELVRLLQFSEKKKKSEMELENSIFRFYSN